MSHFNRIYVTNLFDCCSERETSHCPNKHVAHSRYQMFGFWFVFLHSYQNFVFGVVKQKRPVLRLAIMIGSIYVRCETGV